MSDAAKLPGARETAHATMLTVGTCWSFPLNEEDHSATCKATAAAIETRDAALRSAVVEECAAIVDKDADYNWKRAERFEEAGEDDDAETHESVAMSLEGIARDIRALATRTGGGE